jgi:hypothetical protein
VEITRDKLQLVGVSAFLIAAKNAEPPSLNHSSVIINH